MALVLLVDDNKLLRSTIERALTLTGHEVVTAVDGKSAIALLPTVNCDVVLTDIVMPDMDGLELIRAIRKANPATKVVAMSGGGRGGAMSYLELAKTFGAAATLEKPFAIEELGRVISAVLGDKESGA